MSFHSFPYSSGNPPTVSTDMKRESAKGKRELMRGRTRWGVDLARNCRLMNQDGGGVETGENLVSTKSLSSILYVNNQHFVMIPYASCIVHTLRGVPNIVRHIHAEEQFPKVMQTSQ